MNSSNKIIVEKIKSFKLFDLNSYNILVNNFGIDRVKEVFNDFLSIIITGSVASCKHIYESSTSLIINYLSGEGQSEALYNNIYGLHNPCGRLAETWIDDIKQNPYLSNFLTRDDYYTYCDDDIYVGYRYYDLNKNGFILPFGFGLSYTTFTYDNFKITHDDKYINVSLDIKNIGNFDGSEIIQVYVGKENSNIYRPIKELKGFEKLFIKKGLKETMNIAIDIDDIKAYKEETDSFALEDGIYKIYIAKNTNDIIYEQEIKLNGEIFEKHLKPTALKRKEIDKDYTLNTPGGALLYNQAFKAEHLKLDQISGIGYRKALEFLIKDFLIKHELKDESKVKSTALGCCIDTMIDNPQLKAVASRATWLGNDQTHYDQKYSDNDIQDLKRLIDLSVHWISMIYLTDEAQLIQKI